MLLSGISLDTPHSASRSRHQVDIAGFGASIESEPAALGDELDEHIVVDVPRRRDYRMPGMVGPAMQLPEICRTQVGHRLARAQYRIAVRVVGPHRPSVLFKDEIVWRVFHQADLLQHHFALQIQIRVS